MTKEECLQALKDFTHEVLRDYNNTKFDRGCNKHILKSRFQRQHDLLEQLITEHFDNPSLSLDDLKPGIWVWDDEEKMYYRIESIEGNKIMIIDQSCYDLPWGVYSLLYHENRFYKREKEE